MKEFPKPSSFSSEANVKNCRKLSLSTPVDVKLQRNSLCDPEGKAQRINHAIQLLNYNHGNYCRINDKQWYALDFDTNQFANLMCHKPIINRIISVNWSLWVETWNIDLKSNCENYYCGPFGHNLLNFHLQSGFIYDSTANFCWPFGSHWPALFIWMTHNKNSCEKTEPLVPISEKIVIFSTISRLTIIIEIDATEKSGPPFQTLRLIEMRKNMW